MTQINKEGGGSMQGSQHNSNHIQSGECKQSKNLRTNTPMHNVCKIVNKKDKNQIMVEEQNDQTPADSLMNDDNSSKQSAYNPKSKNLNDINVTFKSSNQNFS